jgi:glycosyltransferase involved in cell wall biosynthesis
VNPSTSGAGTSGAPSDRADTSGSTSGRAGTSGERPVLFVTGHAPPYRVGAFAALHEREGVELALFGGRVQHGGGGTAADLPFPHTRVREHALKGASDLYALAASGRYRAVVCSTGGRAGLLAAWAGARRARVPLLLWASLWAHPRSFAHAFSFPALRRLYRTADAVVTYGPHVSEYVRARGARNVHVAPQAVDNAFWSSPAASPPACPGWPNESEVKFLFAGRPAREKGLGVLSEAWSMSGLQAPTAALVLVGTGPIPPWVPAGGAVVGMESVPAAQLRDSYAAADVLVVPSIPTRTFREPWGLVVNEAMNQELPVIASDAVGAAAGGLVRDGHNGAIVAAGDPVELAAALRRLAGDAQMRARMGEQGRRDVAAYSFDAWARGFSRALASLGLSRGG